MYSALAIVVREFGLHQTSFAVKLSVLSIFYCILGNKATCASFMKLISKDAKTSSRYLWYCGRLQQLYKRSRYVTGFTAESKSIIFEDISRPTDTLPNLNRINSGCTHLQAKIISKTFQYDEGSIKSDAMYLPMDEKEKNEIYENKVNKTKEVIEKASLVHINESNKKRQKQKKAKQKTNQFNEKLRFWHENMFAARTSHGDKLPFIQCSGPNKDKLKCSCPKFEQPCNVCNKKMKKKKERRCKCPKPEITVCKKCLRQRESQERNKKIVECECKKYLDKLKQKQKKKDKKVKLKLQRPATCECDKCHGHCCKPESLKAKLKRLMKTQAQCECSKLASKKSCHKHVPQLCNAVITPCYCQKTNKNTESYPCECCMCKKKPSEYIPVSQSIIKTESKQYEKPELRPHVSKEKHICKCCNGILPKKKSKGKGMKEIECLCPDKLSKTDCKDLENVVNTNFRTSSSFLISVNKIKHNEADPQTRIQSKESKCAALSAKPEPQIKEVSKLAFEPKLKHTQNLECLTTSAPIVITESLLKIALKLQKSEIKEEDLKSNSSCIILADPDLAQKLEGDSKKMTLALHNNRDGCKCQQAVSKSVQPTLSKIALLLKLNSEPKILALPKKESKPKPEPISEAQLELTLKMDPATKREPAPEREPEAVVASKIDSLYELETASKPESIPKVDQTSREQIPDPISAFYLSSNKILASKLEPLFKSLTQSKRGNHVCECCMCHQTNKQSEGKTVPKQGPMNKQDSTFKVDPTHKSDQGLKPDSELKSGPSHQLEAMSKPVAETVKELKMATANFQHEFESTPNSEPPQNPETEIKQEVVSSYDPDSTSILELAAASYFLSTYREYAQKLDTESKILALGLHIFERSGGKQLMSETVQQTIAKVTSELLQKLKLGSKSELLVKPECNNKSGLMSETNLICNSCQCCGCKQPVTESNPGPRTEQTQGPGTTAQRNPFSFSNRNETVSMLFHQSKPRTKISLDTENAFKHSFYKRSFWSNIAIKAKPQKCECCVCQGSDEPPMYEEVPEVPEVPAIEQKPKKVKKLVQIICRCKKPKSKRNIQNSLSSCKCKKSVSGTITSCKCHDIKETKSKSSKVPKSPTCMCTKYFPDSSAFCQCHKVKKAKAKFSIVPKSSQCPCDKFASGNKPPCQCLKKNPECQCKKIKYGLSQLFAKYKKITKISSTNRVFCGCDEIEYSRSTEVCGTCGRPALAMTIDKPPTTTTITSDITPNIGPQSSPDSQLPPSTKITSAKEEGLKCDCDPYQTDQDLATLETAPAIQPPKPCRPDCKQIIKLAKKKKTYLTGWKSSCKCWKILMKKGDKYACNCDNLSKTDTSEKRKQRSKTDKNMKCICKEPQKKKKQKKKTNESEQKESEICGKSCPENKPISKKKKKKKKNIPCSCYYKFKGKKTGRILCKCSKKLKKSSKSNVKTCKCNKNKNIKRSATCKCKAGQTLCKCKAGQTLCKCKKKQILCKCKKKQILCKCKKKQIICKCHKDIAGHVICKCYKHIGGQVLCKCNKNIKGHVICKCRKKTKGKTLKKMKKKQKNPVKCLCNVIPIEQICQKKEEPPVEKEEVRPPPTGPSKTNRCECEGAISEFGNCTCEPLYPVQKDEEGRLVYNVPEDMSERISGFTVRKEGKEFKRKIFKGEWTLEDGLRFVAETSPELLRELLPIVAKANKILPPPLIDEDIDTEQQNKTTTEKKSEQDGFIRNGLKFTLLPNC